MPRILKDSKSKSMASQMSKQVKQEIKHPSNPIYEGITENTSTLITYGVREVFEAFKTDVRTHPGGIERLAGEFGVAEQTIRAWWNPGHGRSLTVANLVEFLMVNPGTNIINALNTISDMFAKHRETEAKRKLQEIRVRMEGA